MFGWVEKISTNFSTGVGCFASVSLSRSCLFVMRFACNSAESEFARSGSAMKSAL